jgi:hypothetical protein
MRIKMKDNTMKSNNLFGRVLVLVVFLMGISLSCTNLDEDLYDSVTPDQFLQGEEQFVSALGAAYSGMSGYASGGEFSVQEVSTDEMIVPTRGQDWDDGGHWRRLALHSYNYEDPEPNGAWGFYYGGINNCNRNIALFEDLAAEGQVSQEDADALIAELIVLREFFYFLAMDVFGNIPVVTDFKSDVLNPPTVPRAEVYAFIEESLSNNVPKLAKEKDGTTYGRMNYWGGRMLQAKLYLNAEVYTGTPAWSECIAACDDIINNGGFELTGNYFDNFSESNTGTNEMIFAVPHDQVFLTGFNLNMRTLHYGNQQTYNLTAQPWNGFCSLEEFYNSYEDEDLRKGDPGTLDGPAVRRGNFVAGYQYKSDGSPVSDGGWEKPDPENPEKPTDPDGEHLNLGSIGTGEPAINELGPQTLRQAGVRIGKWEFGLGSTDNMSNDYAVYRYADVLLMKAEALWRQTGSATNAEALALVNQIRARAGVDDLTTLDGPISFDIEGGVVDGGELFNERGREMFAEHQRRRTLIRWGLWTENEKWLPPVRNVGDVIESGDFTTIFPIPRSRLDANPELDQNPGY